jgi:hypothetical protein
MTEESLFSAADPPFKPATRFRNPDGTYSGATELLGEGGMGSVWLPTRSSNRAPGESSHPGGSLA